VAPQSFRKHHVREPLLKVKSSFGLDFFKLFFWCAPFGYLYFLSFQLLNEPGLGAGIDPGMALTPLPFFPLDASPEQFCEH